ncbi:MAG: VOC family protein [Gemmatimonadetes bacterium]|nr:VOC family protein [Gemmatimonadota bacterium]
MTARVWFDHLVVGVRDLADGRSQFEALSGVAPVYGGEHPELGTHNALVSLGSVAYLEILAPRDESALDPSFGEAIEHERLTPILWALATDDIEAVHRAVVDEGLPAAAPTSGSRVTAEGTTLGWTMFMLPPGAPAAAPFFIEWRPGDAHPATTSPGGCSLRSLTVRSPDHAPLGRLLERLRVELDVTAGDAGSIAASLDGPEGRFELAGR